MITRALSRNPLTNLYSAGLVYKHLKPRTLSPRRTFTVARIDNHTMSNPVPVVLCGRVPAVATAATASLQPEYEVIHVILSLEAGVSQVPALLRGEQPPHEDEEKKKNLGSRNYAKPPAAVIAGGVYDDAMVKEMRDACKGKGAGQVPWLRPDMDALPPYGPGYGAAMAEKIKACLGKVARQGKMDVDGVHYF